MRTLQADQFAWSFWWWVPVSLHVTVHLVCLVILAAFMLGAFTPATSCLAYLITIAYANRAPMANYGLDQINGMAATLFGDWPQWPRAVDRPFARALPRGPHTTHPGIAAGDSSRAAVGPPTWRCV